MTPGPGSCIAPKPMRWTDREPSGKVAMSQRLGLYAAATASGMARVLVTGMSGAGKSTLLDELRRRGVTAVHTDYDGWELPDGLWDENRMRQLLRSHRDLVVSGTVANQGAFYDLFAHVV